MTATYKPTDADGIIRQHIDQTRCGHVSADGRSRCRFLKGHDGPHGEHMFVRAQPAPDFTPISAEEAQSFLAHARKDFRSEANELGYVPVQPCDLERMSLTILALLAAARQGAEDTAKVTRFEVIDHRAMGSNVGRAFFAFGCRVALSYQDDGRTLKVFVDDAAAHPEEPNA